MKDFYRHFQIPPIHEEGKRLFLIFMLCVSASSMLLGMFFFIFMTFIGIGLLLFFRNPHRIIPLSAELNGDIISPADGKVVFLGPISLNNEMRSMFPENEPSELYLCISIFMSLFDVHVNRLPCSGVLLNTSYFPGHFFNASLDKASALNERMHYLFRTKDDHLIVCTQVAGLIAGRIASFINKNFSYSVGTVMGLIRFGSRLDVYVPARFYEINVLTGQTMVASETIIAKKKNAPEGGAS